MLQYVKYQKRKEKLTVVEVAVVVAPILANSLGLAKYGVASQSGHMAKLSQKLGQCPSPLGSL